MLLPPRWLFSIRSPVALPQHPVHQAEPFERLLPVRFTRLALRRVQGFTQYALVDGGMDSIRRPRRAGGKRNGRAIATRACPGESTDREQRAVSSGGRRPAVGETRRRALSRRDERAERAVNGGKRRGVWSIRRGHRPRQLSLSLHFSSNPLDYSNGRNSTRYLSTALQSSVSLTTSSNSPTPHSPTARQRP